MRWGCRFLLLFLIASSASAQSGLTIDKIGKESALGGGMKETAFSTLVEGVIADPGLDVYVLVKSPETAHERIFAAAVDSSRPDTGGRYRWRAICQFGEFSGRGKGITYQIKAVAVAPARIRRGRLLETLTASKIKTTTISVKRVNN